MRYSHTGLRAIGERFTLAAIQAGLAGLGASQAWGGARGEVSLSGSRALSREGQH